MYLACYYVLANKMTTYRQVFSIEFSLILPSIRANIYIMNIWIDDILFKTFAITN